LAPLGRIPDLANDEAYMDPSTIASALKNWLASMPECLITSERYSDFILADSKLQRRIEPKVGKQDVLTMSC
jgi:hypothetical protein